MRNLLFLFAFICMALAQPAPVHAHAQAQAQPSRRTVTWEASVSLHDAQLTTVGVINVERHDNVRLDGEVYSGTIEFEVVSPCWRVWLGTEQYGFGWGQGYCLYFPLAGGP